MAHPHPRQVDVDRHDAQIRMGVEQPLERRHDVEQLGVDEVLAPGVPADHDPVVARRLDAVERTRQVVVDHVHVARPGRLEAVGEVVARRGDELNARDVLEQQLEVAPRPRHPWLVGLLFQPLGHVDHVVVLVEADGDADLQQPGDDVAVVVQERRPVDVDEVAAEQWAHVDHPLVLLDDVDDLVPAFAHRHQRQQQAVIRVRPVLADSSEPHSPTPRSTLRIVAKRRGARSGYGWSRTCVQPSSPVRV